VEAIVEARKTAGRFTDLYHFCQQVDLHVVNRGTLEALVQCGAFDGLGAHRGAMMAALDQAIELGQSAASARRSGQMNLLEGLSSATPPKPQFPDVEPWSDARLLAAEKESLGFFLSSHPLVRYGRELTSLSSPAGTNLAKLDETPHDKPVVIGCMISSVRKLVTKNGRSAGKQMAMLSVEDLTGKGSAVVFAETYEKLGGLLQEQALVFVIGTVDRRRDRPSIIVNDLAPLETALEKLTGSVLLRLTHPAVAPRVLPPPPTLPGIPPAPAADSPKEAEVASPLVASQENGTTAPTGGLQDGSPSVDSPETPAAPRTNILDELSALLARHKGDCPLYVQVRPAGFPGVRATLKSDRQWFVRPCRELVEELEKLLGGQEYLALSPRPPAQPSGNGKRWGRGNGNGHGNGRYVPGRSAGAPAEVE
jgi:hypothetical protein